MSHGGRWRLIQGFKNAPLGRIAILRAHVTSTISQSKHSITREAPAPLADARPARLQRLSDLPIRATLVSQHTMFARSTKRYSVEGDRASLLNAARSSTLKDRLINQGDGRFGGVS